MSDKSVIKEMTGDELKSMLKSNIRFKGLAGIKHPGIKLEQEDLSWWRDSKFGMFIHWGLYSILGRGEWVMHNEKISVDDYRKLADAFNPYGFNAKEWADLAHEAGMKYMVMVSRHHDGFALWDSPGSYMNFTSVKTAAKRDFIKEYVQACRDAGLYVGLYYSPMDWRFPGYFNPHELIDNALLMKKQTYDQVGELVSNYGKIDILWYDGAWLAHKKHDPDAAWLWEPIKLNQMVRSYLPKILINPRSGWEGDFYCDEGSHEIVGDIIPVPWEKCLCICSGKSWGWIHNDPVMSFDDLVRMLVNVIVRDGNLLLNVGPDSNGKIPSEVVFRLKQIGKWMRENKESLYNTRGGPFHPIDRVYGSTYNGRKIYIHILNHVEFMKLYLPPIKQKIINCATMFDQPLEFIQNENGIKVFVPDEYVTCPDTIVALELDSEVEKTIYDKISFTG